MKATPRNSEISRQLRISQAYKELRTTFGREICDRSGIQDQKCRNYFEKSFVRWIFNVIRKGYNPFLHVITAEEFVSMTDVQYYIDKHANASGLKDFSWMWLNEKFRAIHNNSQAVVPEKITKTKYEDKICLSYEWSKNDKIGCEIGLKMYDRACSLYTGDPKYLDLYVLVLISRYEACGSTNNHSSVPSGVVKFCEASVELFGSPFNTCCEQYCSPFVDVEVFFGSLGSFFDFEMGTGVYVMNPPYDEDIMSEAVKRAISALKTSAEITIIVVLPVWDPKTQKKRKSQSMSTREFKALEMIQASNFVKSQTLLGFKSHKFFDYYSNSLICITDAHLIVMSNTTTTLVAEDISLEWIRVTT